MPKDTPLPDTAAQVQTVDCDICVIGAGAGGSALALGAAAFGRRVVLIEKHKMGGDELHYGSVPSKALLASARRAHAMRSASPFGIRGVEPIIDPLAVHQHVKSVIDEIAPRVSIERFNGLGVRVITATARFLGKSVVAAGDYRVTARRFVIATGSSPVIPSIPGMDEVSYFTNETIFDNTKPLPHLIVIGAGATGLELAQAYRRLGSRVTVLEAARALADFDPEVGVVALKRLREEGIDIFEGVRINRVSGAPGRIAVAIDANGSNEVIEGTDLLVAAGRRANVADIGLKAAGISASSGEIKLNANFRTKNGRVYIIGDASGGPRYAHAAEDQAEQVLRTILFKFGAKPKGSVAPRTAFTDPELAEVGLSENEARAKHGRINVLRWPYHELDRAHADRALEGHLKVITADNGLILGAAIVGAQAGEIIQTWSLAISQRLKIRAMTEWTSPHPTYSEINKRAAFRSFATVPSNPYVRKIIALLAKLG